MTDPLLPDMKAAEARHAERQDELWLRGWGRTPPITREDVADFMINRGLMKLDGHPKYRRPRTEK